MRQKRDRNQREMAKWSGGSCQGVGRFRGSFQKGALVLMFNYSAWNDDMVTLNASTVSSFG